jgi:hypothetical protein
MNVSSNSKPYSNKASTMDIGIYLRGASCFIYGNNLTAKGLSPGIGVEGDGNFVVKNLVDQSDIGMRITGSNNTICLNRIANSWEDYFFPSTTPITGIGVEAWGNNTFYANTVADNSWGMVINQNEPNSSTLIYENNFVHNTKQVSTDFPYDMYGEDRFDNGEQGNFWSDYVGKDANADGIGDTPYVIDAKRQDNYPLVTLFDIYSVKIPLAPWVSSGVTASKPHSETPMVATSIVLIVVVAVAIGLGLLTYIVKIRGRQEKERKV